MHGVNSKLSVYAPYILLTELQEWPKKSQYSTGKPLLSVNNQMLMMNNPVANKYKKHLCQCIICFTDDFKYDLSKRILTII